MLISLSFVTKSLYYSDIKQIMSYFGTAGSVNAMVVMVIISMDV